MTVENSIFDRFFIKIQGLASQASFHRFSHSQYAAKTRIKYVFGICAYTESKLNVTVGEKTMSRRINLSSIYLFQ